MSGRRASFYVWLGQMHACRDVNRTLLQKRNISQLGERVLVTSVECSPQKLRSEFEKKLLSEEDEKRPGGTQAESQAAEYSPMASRKTEMPLKSREGFKRRAREGLQSLVRELDCASVE